MQNFNTLPMPEGYGQQVETPQGWRFRHCATFFVGDRCPDCGKEGFIAAANEINKVETHAEPGGEQQESTDQEDGSVDIGDAMASAAIDSEKLQSTPPTAPAPQGGKQTRKPKNQ